MTSDDGSSIRMERDSQLSRSPFYWHNHQQQDQQEEETQEAARPVCRHPPPAVAPKPHRRSRTPPRPPSRTDSLNPASKAKGRPQSVVTRSPLPPLVAGRPLSVPGPSLSSTQLASPSATPSPSPLSQVPSFNMLLVF